MIKNVSPILNALRLATVNEQAAVEFLESQRWGDAPVCPRCGDSDVYIMRTGDSRNKDFRWRCRGCKQMYTVRTASVLEETRLPVRVWIFAIWKAASSKKGYSALQLSREMEITHKSALEINYGYCSISVGEIHKLKYGLEVRHDPGAPGHVLLCNVPFLIGTDEERRKAAEIAGALARISKVETCDHFQPKKADDAPPPAV
jgi:transposase-like protein